MAKPLIILVSDAYADEAWCKELEANGHIVRIAHFDADVDLILGPTCCRFVPGMEAFLPALVKGARKVKYPPKAKA